MDILKSPVKSSRSELIIAGIGTTVCLVITMAIWSSLVSNQPIWLLPGAYFLELMAGAVICFLAFLISLQRASLISWIYSGILVVFSILTGFTVGLLYFPVFIIFLGLSIYSDLKHKRPILAHLGIFLGAGVIQSGVMLAIVRIYTLYVYH